MRRDLAARKVWGTGSVWVAEGEPEPAPVQVVVVFVDAATGTVMGAAPRAAVTGKAVRALPPGARAD